MASRLHYFHVCLVDYVLDLFRRLNLSTHRLVEQQHQGVLRQGQRQPLPRT